MTTNPITSDSDLPFVSCICPTYRRPRMLQNAIACFLAQDYPADRRELVILDDAGQIASQRHETAQGTWEVVSTSRRFDSLPAKYNALVSLSRGDVLCVWEDDDIYLPWHVSAHANVIADAWGEERDRVGPPLMAWSHPSRVLSTYGRTLQEEPARGRFHAAVAFDRRIFELVGGYPLTRGLSFDQQFFGLLGSSLKFPLNPCRNAPPSYCFRWETTEHYHGQAFGEGWYDKVAELPGEHAYVDDLWPEMDAETRSLYERLAKHVG